jgi:hypothetical protein
MAAGLQNVASVGAGFKFRHSHEVCERNDSERH